MGLPLKKIDQTLLHEHSALGPQDECYYLLDYSAGKGFAHNASNNLISDLKKSPDRKGQYDWLYKLEAITEAAYLLNHALPDLIDYSTTTICPIPTSTTHHSPLYDDRLFEALRYACPPEADIQEMIVCTRDHAPVHKSEGSRLSVEVLMEAFRLNPCEPRNTIVLFDDVITSGNHFVACKRLIRDSHPGKRILGVFLARRALS